MLFLTMGDMRHSALWSMWFKQASMLVPKDCATAALCQEASAEVLIREYRSCLSQAGETPLLSAGLGRPLAGRAKSLLESACNRALYNEDSGL